MIRVLHLLWIVPVSVLAGMVTTALCVAIDRVNAQFHGEENKDE